MGEDIWEMEEQVRLQPAKNGLGFTPPVVGHFPVVETRMSGNKFGPTRVE